MMMDIAWLLVALLLVLCILLLVRNRAASQELTSLRGQSRQLREQAQQLSTQVNGEKHMRQVLLETMIDPVFFVDSERNITYCNFAAQQLARGEAHQGRSLMETVRSYELDSIVEETLARRSELPHEITVNERLFRVRVSLLPQGLPAPGAVVILRDVSELQRLGRARRDFVANISHELRTPLTAIRLLTDTLRIGGDIDEEQRAKHLDQIGAQVDALTQLAQEMYDLSLIESGQVPMRMVRVSLHDLAEQVIERMLPQAGRAGTTLLNKVGEEVYVLIDPLQISRVLSNLLHNAIKFTSQGSITIFVTDYPSSPAPAMQAPAKQASAMQTLANGSDTGEDFLTVAVRDTGVGIAKTDLPRIFERFYKVNRARGQGGTGLGLAIAKHIVEAHGGRIWAESTQGQGATFYFTVPRD